MGRSATIWAGSVAFLLLMLVTAVAWTDEARAAAGDLGHADILDLVTMISWEHGLDPVLVHALVRVESDYDPFAVSRKGAMGLMQLMPATAKRLGVSDPFDPEQNVRAGVVELGRLLKRYSGDVPLALAAYNAGEGAVARHGGVPPFRETRGYVRRIMSLYQGRPYGGSQASRPTRAPVRLVRSSGDGEVLITNLGASTAPRADNGSGSRKPPLLGRGQPESGTPSAERRGVLGGGFGS